MEHSVTLDTEKCKGCTTCLKQCPTQAIRVREGKARIWAERCIDCGQCIRVCPHHAKVVVADSFEELQKFRYNIALPAPSLYGQFHRLDDINIVLAAFLRIGFDAVFEVAKAAEMISDLGRREMVAGTCPAPVISSACPAAVRLIRQRFPNLIDHIAPHIAPAELAAILAREEAVRSTGYKPEEIGVFFISPCPAKITAAHSPVALQQPVMDGALSMTEVYLKLLPAMKELGASPPDDLQSAGIIGVGWAASGGESSALLGDAYIAADGIENVIKLLEDVEDGKLPEAEFLEIGACTQGCVGGCLAVENPFIAKARLRRLQRGLPVSRNKAGAELSGRARRSLPLEYVPVWRLDEDMAVAMDKHARIENLYDKLPGLNCGSCGAPGCHALAEDVVLGQASEYDCIFRMRETMHSDEYLPAPFRSAAEGEGGDKPS